MQLDAKVAELAQALVAGRARGREGLQGAGAGRGGPARSRQLLIERTVKGIADIRVSDEGREGIQSFLEKRKPAGWPG